MNTSNIFSNIPENFNDEIFQEIISNDSIRIERIISKGHTSPNLGWYDQDENEWVIVLEGEALLSFENNKDIRLRKGDYINIPAHTKHKVSWTDPTSNTVWLAIFY